MFIGDWMERGQRYYGDALAVVDADKGAAGRFSYRDMNARANRLASWLRAEAGVAPGERVAILAMNGVEYLDALFACCKLGAILVPLGWRAHARELVDLLAMTAPVVLIFGQEFSAAAAVLADADAGRGVRRFVCIGAGAGDAGDADGDADGDASLPESTRYEQILAGARDEPVHARAVAAEDIALFLFTGGTTGLPRAARISYRMIAWNTLNTIIHELSRGDVTITHTPMFHTGGLLVYTLPLLTLGGTVVIMRKWTPEALLALIERERATVLFCVPAQYRMMMDHERFARADLSSIRFFTSGGAPLPVSIIEHYRATHGVVFKQGFGMTEFGPGVFSMAPEFAVAKAGSIGQPNYFIDARIAGEDGRELLAGEVGELWLAGPCMCSGYVSATDGALDPDGWFHTGDLAYRDEDGFYYITDRKKDMYISGGENVYPAEVERALAEHPGVAQCAVIGVADERWGEVGKAFIVRAPGAAVAADDVIAHCRDRLARYKVPRHVAFVDELPMSPAGKVQKRALRIRNLLP